MAEPTSPDLAQQLASTQVALNIVWVVLAGCLVMFMQAGFAMVETGLTRARNVAHTMGMNFLVYSIGIVGFWLVGFGLQMGGVGALTTFGGDASLNHEVSLTIGGHEYGLFGFTGFMLPPHMFNAAVATTFFFQMVFMDTTATIPTGALAERWRFIAFMLFSLAISTIIYPVFANWVWGGGWLSALGRNLGLGHGHVDFAGSSVVHLTGGVLAFVCAKLLGPRIGKYDSAGNARAIPGHNLPMVVVGTFVLAFGWFGFNAGSTLAGTDTRLAIVVVNTMLASAAGALSACLYTWRKFDKPDLSMMCNGMLAGLVAITAPCAFVSSSAAMLIGALAGVLVVVTSVFVEHTLKIDDPVGAISVHGANGAWGTLALGLLADGSYGAGLNGVDGGVRGLFYGDAGQLYAACIAIGANVLYVGAVGAACFMLIERFVGNRVAIDDELRGLDVAELGMEGYPPEQGFSQQTPGIGEARQPLLPSTVTSAPSSGTS